MSEKQDEMKTLRMLSSGFMASRVLLTANNLGMFDRLKKPVTAALLARRMKLDARAAGYLLDALTGLGLVRKSGDKYSNTPLSRKYLVKDSPSYQGDIIRHMDNLWTNWSALDEVVKTGKSHKGVFDIGSFIMGMHNLASMKVKTIVDSIDLSGVKTVLDLGGGPGTYAMEIARRKTDAVVFDRPEAITIARSLADKRRLKNICFIEGDFMTDKLGKGYDLIFISQIFHAYPPKDCLMLLKKCLKSLNPAGRIIVQEFMISNDHTAPPSSALFAINMLVNTEAGRCYSPKDIKELMKNAGLKKITTKAVLENSLTEGMK